MDPESLLAVGAGKERGLGREGRSLREEGICFVVVYPPCAELVLGVSLIQHRAHLELFEKVDGGRKGDPKRRRFRNKGSGESERLIDSAVGHGEDW